jgi:hypothetical protein
MNDPNGQGEHDHPGDQSGIIVFGGGGGTRGCAGRGCLFWTVLSVVLTILANLVLLLLSGGESGAVSDDLARRIGVPFGEATTGGAA